MPSCLARGDFPHACSKKADDIPPLSLAANRGHVHAVKLLLSLGADLDDKTWWTAVEAGHRAVIEELVRAAGPGTTESAVRAQ